MIYFTKSDLAFIKERLKAPILQASNAKLVDLAKLADKVMEVSDYLQVCAVEKPHAEAAISEMNQSMSRLEKNFDTLLQPVKCNIDPAFIRVVLVSSKIRQQGSEMPLTINPDVTANTIARLMIFDNNTNTKFFDVKRRILIDRRTLLVDALANASHFANDASLTLTVDASTEAVGAVEGKSQPLGFYSKKLTPTIFNTYWKEECLPFSLATNRSCKLSAKDVTKHPPEESTN
ncbi:hypothetical protein FF38_12378 [Lucilia cuprina]|uniref:Reverse transcriptase/retrotransposon-derived protein RNase H-like domain-containing protein n=1 Tax=Lucilia cuprina TaxID=7375 RepID=A0A0L0CBR0_LUCCU|nr:hypothetical protein FF38_12378 [Lucilia cuprina]